MKLEIVFIGLLGLLLGSTSADTNISVDNDNNSQGGTQRVSINNDHNVANVDNDNGWDGSWNSIWDFNNGFVATRIFAKKTCIVHKINKNVVPSIQDFERLSKNKPNVHTGPSPKSQRYMIDPQNIKDLAQFGTPIETMCKGLPTYKAQEVQGQSFLFFSGPCFSANILLIFDISYCGETIA
ncbi:gastrokine-1 [Monodelphis domestica]|uniref:Gastrokine-1 n=1 Tax=Monodelphis domestica TaxID=13616 RepID=A0A5F8GV03_MONDO|nr:gastrokine-1 [Monodelphis domestica]